MRALAPYLALAVLTGCGSASTPSTRPALREATTRQRAAAPTIEAPPSTRRVPLLFELGGQPFPSPLIEALIAGYPTWMVVDTGATHHIIAEWLAAELNEKLLNSGDYGVDHAGQAIRISRLERVRILLGGLIRVAPPHLVVAVPDAMRRLGIGGFVSPQALASEGRAIVLDLRAGSMSEAPFDEAIRALGEGGFSPTRIRVCGAPNAGAKLLTQATIEGFELTVELDSGSTHTTLSLASEAGKELALRAKSKTEAYAASGRYTVPTFEGAKVRIGTFETEASIDIFPARPKQGCSADAYVGMNVLQTCVLVLGKKEGGLRCQAP